jgi:hypothetical protein
MTPSPGPNPSPAVSDSQLERLMDSISGVAVKTLI